MIKQVAVIGSTGSIGQQTLEVIASQSDKFRVVALAAGENLELLNDQIRQFQPEMVALAKSVSPERVNHPKPLFDDDRVEE